MTKSHLLDVHSQSLWWYCMAFIPHDAFANFSSKESGVSRRVHKVSCKLLTISKTRSCTKCKSENSPVYTASSRAPAGQEYEQQVAGFYVICIKQWLLPYSACHLDHSCYHCTQGC